MVHRTDKQAAGVTHSGNCGGPVEAIPLSQSLPNREGSHPTWIAREAREARGREGLPQEEGTRFMEGEVSLRGCTPA